MCVGDDRHFGTVQYYHGKWTSILRAQGYLWRMSQQGHVWSKGIVYCKSMLKVTREHWSERAHSYGGQTQRNVWVL